MRARNIWQDLLFRLHLVLCDRSGRLQQGVHQYVGRPDACQLPSQRLSDHPGRIPAISCDWKLQHAVVCLHGSENDTFPLSSVWLQLHFQEQVRHGYVALQRLCMLIMMMMWFYALHSCDWGIGHWNRRTFLERMSSYDQMLFLAPPMTLIGPGIEVELGSPVLESMFLLMSHCIWYLLVFLHAINPLLTYLVTYCCFWSCFCRPTLCILCL